MPKIPEIPTAYIVMIHYHYEGSEIDSVYKDEKQAIKRKTDMEQIYHRSLDHMTISIEEWKIS